MSQSRSSVVAKSSSRKKLYRALLACSQALFASHLIAGPQGGEIVGGVGTITQDALDTRVEQVSDRLAIDWQTFDVAAS